MGLLGLYRVAFGFWQARLIAAVSVVCAGLLAWSSVAASRWLPAAAAGALSWGVGEYVFHRFVLHLPRPRAEWLRRVHAMLHWQHHQEPSDPGLLFIPLPGVISLLALSAGIGRALGGWQAGAAATLGLGAMLLVYETTHLAAHVSYLPRTRWGQFLKRFHRLHHYKNEHYWFGVTHPFMDRLAGTWPAHAQVERSKTARNLGMEPES